MRAGRAVPRCASSGRGVDAIVGPKAAIRLKRC